MRNDTKTTDDLLFEAWVNGDPIPERAATTDVPNAPQTPARLSPRTSLPEKIQAPTPEDLLFIRTIVGLDASDLPAPRHDGGEASAPPDTDERRRPLRTLLRGGRQKSLSVGSTLDLHGMQRGTALQRLRAFLEQERRRGTDIVCVITGIGHHSDATAVLKDSLRGWLTAELSSLVAEWAPAPPHLGGAGAVLIALRRG